MIFLLETPVRFGRLIIQSVRLAAGQIWANKVRSILTTLGIIIGVASVTAVIAALSGLKVKIMSDIETFGTNRIFIFPERPDSGRNRRASWDTIRFRPEQFDGLLEFCPSVSCFTRTTGRSDTIRYKERTLDSVSINGIESAWHTVESRPVVIGRPFSVIDESHARPVCLLSPSLRDKLAMDRDCSGEFVHIGYQTYRVLGIVEEKPNFTFAGDQGSQYEVFIPFMTLYQNYSQPQFRVMAASKSPEVSDEARAELTFFLRQKRGIKPGEPDNFSVLTIESEVRKFKEIATRFTLVAAGIVCISLLVGGIGIMNIMLVSVSERTREIGLRKAVGAQSSAILTQFLVEAVVLCCIGGLVGLGLGQLLTMAIAKIPNVNLDQAYIPAWAVLMALGFSAMVGIFFGMFPAVKAARLDPIEALRHE